MGGHFLADPVPPPLPVFIISHLPPNEFITIVVTVDIWVESHDDIFSQLLTSDEMHL